MDRPFAAYTGEDPYVFVSYAHEDVEAIYPELSRLSEAGFNIWYDEGIPAGTSWRDELAESLADCSVFLFFVTPVSVRSVNCTKEVNFALTKDRPILAIHLESVSLPPGLEFSLSDVQAIERHNLNDADYYSKTNESLVRLLPKSVKKIDELQITSLVHHAKTYTRYTALQGVLKREVEVILLGEEISTAEVQALIEEAQLFASINQANFQIIHGHGNWEGRRYFVVEKSSFPMTLHHLVYSRSFSKSIPLYHLLKIVLQIAIIFEELHRRNLVLPSFSPALFGIRVSGEVFLKFLSLDSNHLSEVHRLSEDESLRYASPEQLMKEPITIESNFYSLGILIYEMMVGLLPYSFNKVFPNLRPEEILENVEELREKTAFSSEQESLLLLNQRNSLRQRYFGLLTRLLSFHPKERAALVEKKALPGRGKWANLGLTPYGDGTTFSPRHSEKQNLLKEVAAMINELEDDSNFLERVAGLEHRINPAILAKVEAGQSLTEEEAERYLSEWYHRMGKREGEWLNYQGGELAHEAFNAVGSVFDEWFRWEVNRELWDTHQSDFNEEFVSFVNSNYVDG